MPERKRVIRVGTEAVQGEDSWVDVRRPTVGERVASLERDNAADPRLPYERNAAEVCGYVVDWNWVDDEGQPLPKPSDNPKVHQLLTDDEVRALLDAVWGTASTRKN